MNSKSITRNKKSLPINFCTTGNFVNLHKIKFIPIYNSLKMSKNSKASSKKNSYTNLSETIPNIDKSKDELIKKLKDRISFLENRIKILEKQMNKISKRSMLNKTLTSKNNTSTKKLLKRKITTIPLDKNLLKSKLSKNKKKFFEILEVNKIIKKSRSKSFHNKDNFLKLYRNNYHSTINTSNSNWNTTNNSCTNSGCKAQKKTPKLINKANSIKSLHSLLSNISKTEKGQNSFSNIQRKKRNFCGLENKNIDLIERKINAIPKKGRKNFNLSPKMMISTNYSNNISSSFKDDGNLKKNNPSKKLTNNNSFFEKHSFIEVKIKLDNIHKRTKNLLEFYSTISLDKKEFSQLKNNMNEDKIFPNYYHYIKISKCEKPKKE